MSKLFKANPSSSSAINRQCDPLPDVSALTNLVWTAATSTDLPERCRHWLQHAGSLTARLQEYTASLSLQLLTAGWQPVSNTHTSQLMRQVLLSDGQQPWVWGLTEVDVLQLHNEPLLSNWSTEPLGALLFADDAVGERRFEVADFSSNHAFMRMLPQWGCGVTQPLWGRRSHLHFRSCPLTLTEVFLPEHPMYGV
jgi:chorismate--pyruvate lyase